MKHIFLFKIKFSNDLWLFLQGAKRSELDPEYIGPSTKYLPDSDYLTEYLVLADSYNEAIQKMETMQNNFFEIFGKSEGFEFEDIWPGPNPHIPWIMLGDSIIDLKGNCT